MKRIIALLIPFLIAILAPMATPAATVFYVSKSGNDDNPGTRNAPFATIQKAADLAKAGDSVKVLAGVYTPQNGGRYGGMVIFRNSGTADNPIIFEAVGEVVVRGDGGVANFGGIFEINGAQNRNTVIHDIVIRGFRLENSGWFGFHLNRTRNIVLENNYTYNTGGSGIQARQSQNIIVRRNTLERACVSPDTTIDTQEIISLSDVDGFEVAYNHVFNGGIANGGNGGEGIDAKTGSRNGTIHHNLVHDLVRLGIYVDSWNKTSENISVYNNTVYNCESGIAVSSERGGMTKRVQVFNNVIYNNRYAGVVISSWAANGPRENIEIINNTIFRNGFYPKEQNKRGGGILVGTARIKNILIRNNIVSQNNSWQILVHTEADKIVVDHNLIDGFRGYTGANYREQRGNSFVEGNPLFVDSGTRNFQLKSNSPAIDRGLPSLAPNKDFNSNVRPRSGGIDLGAYEAD